MNAAGAASGNRTMAEARQKLQAELPPVLATIADAAGLDAALAIARAHGGTRVVTPTLASGHNWLTDLVGPERAAEIVEALGPARRIDMPLGPDALYLASRRKMVQRMRELTEQQMSAPEIARLVGTTERSVRRWWARWRHVDPNQADLFG